MQSLRSKELEKKKTQREREPYFNSIFGKVAYNQDGVCSNCFRRTHHISDMRKTKQKVDSSLSRMMSDKIFHPIRENTSLVYVEGSTPSEPKRICNCGVFDNSTTMRPLKVSKALEYTSNIAKRLFEWGIEFDQDILFDTITDCVYNIHEVDGQIKQKGVNDIDFYMAIKKSTPIKYSRFMENAHYQNEFGFGTEQSLENTIIDPDAYDAQEWIDRGGRISDTRYGPATTEDRFFEI